MILRDPIDLSSLAQSGQIESTSASRDPRHHSKAARIISDGTVSLD
jgi:hypothetical protein